MINEHLAKLKAHPEFTVELSVKYGAKPDIRIDGKSLKTDYAVFDQLVDDLGKKLGLALK